jgi:serine/threonine-protein kinase
MNDKRKDQEDIVQSSDSSLKYTKEISAQSGLQTVDGPSSESSGSFKLRNQRFGHYEIVGELGFGGMGVVYKAYDPSLKRFAALKIIRTDNPDHAIRFVQEAQAQARVQHENVCRV